MRHPLFMFRSLVLCTVRFLIFLSPKFREKKKESHRTFPFNAFFSNSSLKIHIFRNLKVSCIF